MEYPVANRGLGSPIQCCIRETGWRGLLTVHAYLVMALEWQNGIGAQVVVGGM